MLKTSALVCVAVISLTLLAHQNRDVEEFVEEKIIHPVKTYFSGEEHRDYSDKVEHGHMDNFGRDLIRETQKHLKIVTDGIKRTFSKESTDGLDCNKTFHDGKVDSFKSKLAAIYPGTKWCGDGNISSSFEDLGKFEATDACCRAHDTCPEDIAAGSTKYGLINNGLFTRSHCDCDRAFHECLNKAEHWVAESIGYTYFTILGPQCFKQEYPIVDCAKEISGRCVEYLFEKEREKEYQWFDNLCFKS